MDMVFRDEDFPLRSANGFVLKQDGAAVAWCPSRDVAAEIAKWLNRGYLLDGIRHGFGGVLGTFQRSPAEVSALEIGALDGKG